MRILKKLFLILLILVYSPAHGGIKEDISKTIVRVRSGSKYSTGFFWKNGKTIVTTLHSISNQNDIEVYVNNRSQWYDAIVVRTLKNADLILLQINNCESDYFINQKYVSKPSIDTDVFSIGYNSGNANYQDRDFSVGFIQGNRLKDLLPVSAEREINELGFPSLQTEIIYLKGQLLHGFSGAPIVDFRGKLAGIADGGLENGAAGISWCVSAKLLDELEQSNENFPNIDQAFVNVLFSDEGFSSENPVIHLNDFQFQKVKTRTFAQLDRTGNYSVYNEMGLNQLLHMFQMRGIHYNDFTYDIYVEHNTGATVAIPTGMRLQEANDTLFATSRNNNNKIVIELKKTHNPQRTSTTFEQNIMRSTNIYTWIQDPSLSFMMPLIRPDNVIINRKAFFNFNPNKYIFEVLAAKESTFLGLYVLMDNAMNYTNRRFNNPTEAARLNLAAQLSTFTF